MLANITLRDYFVAHAPAHPEPWFRPEMPPRPVVPEARNITDLNLREELRTVLEACVDPESQEAAEWLIARQLADAEAVEWDCDHKKQCYVQWPGAWADEQILQRVLHEEKVALEYEETRARCWVRDPSNPDGPLVRPDHV